MDKREQRYEERVLPSQPDLRDLYSGPDLIFYERLFNMVSVSCAIKRPTEEFDLEQSPDFAISLMGSDPILLQFLKMLVMLKKPRHILEIGTFIGASAMAMATVMPKDGVLTTVEKFPAFAEIARRNFLKNGFGSSIELCVGDAFDLLSGNRPRAQFDLIFLDGNKERYAEYFNLLDPMLITGGLFIVDDVLFNGDVLNEVATTQKGRGVQEFLGLVKANKNYHRVLLPFGNGIMLMVKME